MTRLPTTDREWEFYLDRDRGERAEEYGAGWSSIRCRCGAYVRVDEQGECEACWTKREAAELAAEESE